MSDQGLFERPHHQRIAVVLGALDAGLLERNGCYFGGGTAIALRFGEYRESVDVDFLVSDLAGYRNLRQLLTGPAGVQALCTRRGALKQVRDVRADQYGIRTMLDVDGTEIKFEIVLEGRIKLDEPGASDRVCGVATLVLVDMLASKLLANSDRWADDSVFSRDLIDLAMMQPKKLLKGRPWTQAIAKAAQAYGDSIEADLAKSIEHLLSREGRLDRCMKAMQIAAPKAVVWQRIKALG